MYAREPPRVRDRFGIAVDFLVSKIKTGWSRVRLTKTITGSIVRCESVREEVVKKAVPLSAVSQLNAQASDVGDACDDTLEEKRASS